MFPMLKAPPGPGWSSLCLYEAPHSQQYMWQKSGWWWRAFCCWVRPEAGARGWEVGGCQVMEMSYLKLIESCVCCLCSVLCLVSFSIWNSLSCHWYGERFPILRGPVPVLPGLWSSSCSPFLLELTAPSFLLPRTLFLFYYSTTMSSW